MFLKVVIISHLKLQKNDREWSVRGKGSGIDWDLMQSHEITSYARFVYYECVMTLNCKVFWVNPFGWERGPTTGEVRWDEVRSSRVLRSPFGACIRRPNPLQSSFLLYTFWSTDRPLRSPDSLIEPKEQRTLDCWIFWGYSLLTDTEIKLVRHCWIWSDNWPGGILQTVAGCQPYLWLQLGLCTNMLLSLRHSANTSPPM